jgi:ATP-dependent helicase HrpA
MSSRAFSSLHKEIDKCMRSEQHALRRRLRNIGKKSAPDKQSRNKKPSTNSTDNSAQPTPPVKNSGTDTSSAVFKAGTGTDAALDALRQDITKAIDRQQRRVADVPVPDYPEQLPVVQHRDEIIEAIKNHPVTIICGETGSGKTTQIPKMCLQAGLGVNGMIGHTQPRRIAARSVSDRIASELKTELGAAVGYKVRFSDKLSPQTYIKLMTDGILLAEIQSDPWLNQYDTIIVDEAHERSLNIDFILGYLKRLLTKRRDLKIIITSATIDPDTFSRHFNDAPVILAEGRSYPVEVRYQPWDEDESDERDQPQAIFDACEELASIGSGDVLVFLPGERDIRETADYLGRHSGQSRLLRGVEVLPMLARLSAAEQAKIFKPHGNRRIVLATNVAETSLTVPGIRYVVDSGLARMSRYSVRSKVQRLPIEKISQASANQRKGRCGREAPGVCIRLYSEEDFLQRPEFTEPEILRTNLASVILQMEVSRLGQVEDFPFVEAPDSRLINDGYRLLVELGAVDTRNRLTKLGRTIARLPIDPRLARILIEAKQEGCINEALSIVSALSIQDPRERPMAKQAAADELHSEFNHEKSDFLALVNMWEFCRVQSERLSGNQFRKMCKQRFLSYLRVREWRDIRRQLQQIMREQGGVENTTEASYDKVHRALLTGLLGNVAIKEDRNLYHGTRNRKVMIFPGSGVFGRAAKWIMAAEVSETTRLYARGVAGIEPEWIEAASEHLLKHSYSGATWQRKRAQVGAYRKSTLYGLVVVEKKRVNYGPINPQESREIFIRSGLVEGNYNTKSGFYRHNLKLVDEVITLEEKSRRRDILVDPEELYRFYDSVIPEGIYSGPLFEKWREKYEADYPRGLWFTRDLLLQDDEPGVSKTDYPDQIEMGGVVLPLKYHFSPGAATDGVTLTVPVSLLNRISAAQCEWLVPGMLAEKITAMIKSLPKPLRKNYVPAPDYATRVLPLLDAHRALSLSDALTQCLNQLSRSPLTQEDWVQEQLPEHLKMRLEVLDADGKRIDQGRDIAALQQRYQSDIEEQLSGDADNSFERTDLKDWNFGDLPEFVDLQTQGVTMKGYPALVHENQSVSLRLFATPETAAREMPAGLRALYKKVLQKEVKYLIRNLPGIDVLCLRFAVFGKSDVLKHDIVDAAIDTTFNCVGFWPRTREAFHNNLEQHSTELIDSANRICTVLGKTLESHRQVARRMSGSVSLSWVEPMADIKDQIAQLIYPGFVTNTPSDRLARLPIYFSAIDKRLDSLDREPDRDRRRRAELLPVWEQTKTVAIDAEYPSPQAQKIRWLFEELRVSVFAQELGVIDKVSVPRIESLLGSLDKVA